MLTGLPTTPPSRLLYYQVALVGKVIDFLSARRRRWVVVAGFALLFMLGVGVNDACAGCNTIPERKEALCQILGYPGFPCQIQWERNGNGRFKGVLGELELIADSHTDESLLPADLRTSTVFRFSTPRVDVQKIFGVNGDKPPDALPCITPRCTIQQQLDELDYSGVGEDQLLDVAHAMTKLVWQPPDPRIVEALREAYDAGGLPVALWAFNPRLDDQSATELASRLRVRVAWLFALPAD